MTLLSEDRPDTGQHAAKRDAPMTPSQVGLLVESLLSGKAALNVLQVLAHFDGETVDAAALRAAWGDLAARHQVLRLSLHPLDPAGPHQTAHPSVQIDYEHLDWTGSPAADPDALLDEWLEQDRRQAVPTEMAPCWRVRLIDLPGGGRQVMVWTFHHALLDGGGYRILLRDLFALYQAHRDGGALPQAGPAQPGFLDHCRAVAALDHRPAQEFFRQHLAGFDTPNALDPVFAPDPATAAAADPQRRADLQWRLDADLSEALRARAGQAGASTADLINAAWALVLARCSGSAEAVFGITRSGRHLLEGGEGIAGCQINTLPCRALLRDQTLDGLLRELRAFSRAIRAFEQTPLSALAEICDVPGGRSLFDSLVMFDRGSLPRQMQALGPDWAHRHVEERSQMATMLQLSAYDDAEMLLRLDYDPARVSDSGAERLFDYLGAVLRGFAVAAPETPLAQIDMLPGYERQQLLGWGTPAMQLEDGGESVIARFEAVARRQPDRIAVTQIGKRRKLTYRALETRANHLARQLRDLGVEPGDVVGLALPRGADFIIAMLAAFKAQAAFLPLDPSYTQPVLQDMIDRSGAVALFSDAGAAAHLGAQNIPVLRLDDPELAGDSASPPRRSAYDPERRAYVIFTSGSTGKPKGVEVPHRALSQHAQAITGMFGLGDADRVLQFASLNFDVSIEEILPTLLAGAQLVLRNDQMAQSMPDLLAALAENRITVSNLPTAFWHVLVAHMDDSGARMPADLRLMIVGGERVSGDLLARWLAMQPDIRWLNGYGPTEATITSTCHDVQDPPFRGGEVPIGRPTGHARAYVVCPDGSLAPQGAAGELWLGGPAIALGYLGRPDLTEAVFLPDPFAPDEPQESVAEGPVPAPARVYRTGDKVAWLPEGVLAYHGRIDRQIKLRGYRIELSAIEAALEADPAIGTAVAGLDNPGSDQARILAWVKPHEGAEPLDEPRLLEALREHLPGFMIPRIVVVDHFPQTPGGKVDTARLPRPAGEAADSGADQGDSEDADTAAVQQIFRSLLGRESVGPDASFFDLGGHSLLSVRLMSMIERQFGQRLTLATLYESPTARGIAAELKRLQHDDIPNCLIPFQPQGNAPPLYAVHILGPKGVYFRPMAGYLGHDQPVLGLTLDLLDPSTPTSLPEIAAIYRANIQRHAPEGPIQLIAVSQGSYIAYELAQQLLAEGRDVAALYLLDAEGPGGRPQRKQPASLGQYVRKLRSNFTGILRSRLLRLRDEARFRVDRLQLSLSRHRLLGGIVRQPNTRLAHQAAIDLAVAEYQPASYPREITLFLGRDNVLDTLEGIASGLGWNVVAPAGVRVIETGGLHLAMVHEPHLRELVAHLRPLLREVAARD